MQKSIAYLGDQFSYHYIAAQEYKIFDVEYIGFDTFDKIVDCVNHHICDYGILAIYNSLTGFVFDKANNQSNIERILANDFQVLQSISLQIQLQFGALRSIPFSDIEKIFSHHVALKEAKTFLKQFSPEILIETNSTSSGIKEVATKKLEKVAAIGNREAMQHFGLQILAENIDDHENNFTKFLIFQKRKNRNIDTTISHMISSFIVQLLDQNQYMSFKFKEESSILFLEKFSIKNQTYFYGEVHFENENHKNNMLLNWRTKGMKIKILN